MLGKIKFVLGDQCHHEKDDVAGKGLGVFGVVILEGNAFEEWREFADSCKGGFGRGEGCFGMEGGGVGHLGAQEFYDRGGGLLVLTGCLSVNGGVCATGGVEELGHLLD